MTLVARLRAFPVIIGTRHPQVLSFGKISPNAILNAEGLDSRNRHKPLPSLSLGKVTAENTSIGGYNALLRHE